jgi:hypothetical protein
MILGLALVQSLCEELAFRGFILGGLRHRFRARPAVLLSSFLFALFQMNVFQFVPHFLLGVVMGALVVRAGSIVPAVVFRFAYTSLVFTFLAAGEALFPDLFRALSYEQVGQAHYAVPRLGLSAGCLLLAVLLLARVVRRGAWAASEPEAPAAAVPTGEGKP